MKRKIRWPLFLTVCFSFLLLGCTTPRMYYWGDYSKSLYSYRKTPKDETLLRHKQVLENIIEESQKANLRIPPGVYAELGYIYFRENNGSQALKYFELEEKLYPESKIFMQRLTQAVKARQDQNEEIASKKEK